MSTESEAHSAVAPAIVSPGAMIREGRERMRLSLDDLAGVTKLSYHTLEALERDDFSAMLEPVYVRGYYRKCAKVLDLPEKALLDAYEARVVQKAPEPPAKLRLASGAELGSGSRLPVALAIVVAIVAVVVLGIVWVARNSVQSEPVNVAEPLTPTVTSAEPEVAAPVAPAESAPVVAPSTDGASGAPTEAPAVTPDAPAAAAPEAPVATADSAVLNFNSASWVRVDDATGKTLYNDMGQPGEKKVFSGPLPLNVFLGNAPVVSVEFQGRPIDVKPYVRSNNTARFTLPPATN